VHLYLLIPHVYYFEDAIAIAQLISSWNSKIKIIIAKENKDRVSFKMLRVKIIKEPPPYPFRK
jgi:hypothetical protein